MNTKETFQQAKQTELDGFKTQIEKFKVSASTAKDAVKVEMDKQIKMLEAKIEEGKTKLAELKKSGDSTFEAMKKGIETAWDSMKTAFTESAKTFKA
jgi:nitrogen fixation protein FixH